jgi:DNA-binding SARP family transcriptional activator
MGEIPFRILGPIEVEADGHLQRPGGRNTRALLLALVLDVAHAVPLDRLIWVLWPDDPPQTAVHTVRSIVSRLRTLIGQHRIEAVDHSYVLRADPDEIDAVVFERRIRESAAVLDAGRPDAAAALARSALELWRGEPFGDLVDAEFARWEALRLDELRSRAMELVYEAEVVAGHGADVLARLEVEVEAAPYRERLWSLLMRALAEEGRRVEALDVYARAVAVLRDAGAEPGPALRALEERIRTGDGAA